MSLQELADFSSEATCTAGELPDNRLKNRFINILPCMLRSDFCFNGAVFILLLDIRRQDHALACSVAFLVVKAGSVAEWLACWTQAQKGPGSNRSRDAVR